MLFELFGRNVPVVLQSSNRDCALACLAMIAGYHGNHVSIHELQKIGTISSGGLSLRQIIKFASVRLALSGRAVKIDLNELNRLSTPFMAHWDSNHFVVIEQIKGKSAAVVIDPAVGRRQVSFEELSVHFTGVAVEFEPTSEFLTQASKPMLRVLDLLPMSAGVRRVFWICVALSLVLQILTLLSPFYMQLIIDRVLLQGQHSFLVLVLIVFLGAKILELALGVIRDLSNLILSNLVMYGMSSGVIRHLFHLPYEYFSRRTVADIQERVRSLNSIRQVLVSGGISSIIDCLLFIALGVVLFLYNPIICLIAVSSILMYGVIRVVMFVTMRNADFAVLQQMAAEADIVLDALGSTTSLKLNNLLQARFSHWQNAHAKLANLQFRSGFYRFLTTHASDAIFSLSLIFVVYIAALFVINGDLTVGMLTAALIYKGQFEARGTALLNFLFSYKLLDASILRLSDVVETVPLSESNGPSLMPPEMSLKFERVNFSYDESSRPVIRNASFELSTNEKWLVRGNSGSGKSTILQLALGLLKPGAGTVLWNDIAVSESTTLSQSSQIGTVLQNDALFLASLQENITCFQSNPDFERLSDILRLLNLDTVVAGLPSGLSTQIGDSITPLSSGQVQRVLLARALYKQPRLLVLDEPTSHLDSVTERDVFQHVSSLNCTVLIASHSDIAPEYFGRALVVEGGEISALNTPLPSSLNVNK